MFPSIICKLRDFVTWENFLADSHCLARSSWRWGRWRRWGRRWGGRARLSPAGVSSPADFSCSTRGPARWMMKTWIIQTKMSNRKLRPFLSSSALPSPQRGVSCWEQLEPPVCRTLWSCCCCYSIARESTGCLRVVCNVERRTQYNVQSVSWIYIDIECWISSAMQNVWQCKLLQENNGIEKPILGSQ